MKDYNNPTETILGVTLVLGGLGMFLLGLSSFIGVVTWVITILSNT